MQQRVADVEADPHGHVRRIEFPCDQSTLELPPSRTTRRRAPDASERGRQLMEAVQVQVHVGSLARE